MVCYYFSQSAVADVSHNNFNQAGRNGEQLVNEENIDWGEYSRIDQGELDIALSLSQVNSEIFAKVTFKNISDRTLNLFTFNIDSRFKVYLNDTEFNFNGPMASIAPSKRWYTEVPSGESFVETVSLSKSYDLPKAVKGKLSVVFNNPGGGDADKSATAEQQF